MIVISSAVAFVFSSRLERPCVLCGAVRWFFFCYQPGGGSWPPAAEHVREEQYLDADPTSFLLL